MILATLKLRYRYQYISLTTTRIIKASKGTRCRRRARRTEPGMLPGEALPAPPTSMSLDTYSKMEEGLLLMLLGKGKGRRGQEEESRPFFASSGVRVGV